MFKIINIRQLQKLKHYQLTSTKRFYCNYEKTRECKEIKIPVPWGHIAGKWWGPQDKRPILAIHGWQDNCGTFDTLVPLLPPHLGVLAIDMPGHGLSSWIPPGMFYHLYDGIIVIRRILEYYNWQKVSLMGHSLGSILGFIYSSVYPHDVDMVIGIDMLKPVSNIPGSHRGKLSKIITKFLKYDELNRKSEPPSYQLHEIASRISEATRGSVSDKSAQYLLRRSISQSKKDPNKYYFTRDPRLKSGFIPGFLQVESVAYASNIICPIMNIKAKNSPYFEDSKNYFEVLNELKKHNKNVVRIEVDGTHHVHLNHPERIYKDINDFILKYDIEERNILKNEN